MVDIPDAPWIRYADNDGRPYDDGYSQYDYDYDHQDDERDRLRELEDENNED